MFKLIKWVYERGRLDERNRIKRLISEFGTEVSNQRNTFEMYYGKMNGSTLKEKKHDLEVHDRAMRVLSKLLEPSFIGERDYGPPPIDRGEGGTQE